VHPHLMALIKDLYSSNTACVAEGSTRSPTFPMRTGLRQGCVCVWAGVHYGLAH